MSAKKVPKRVPFERFKSDWFKLYPWLTYDVGNRQICCLLCQVFMYDNRLTFTNWKKDDGSLSPQKGLSSQYYDKMDEA